MEREQTGRIDYTMGRAQQGMSQVLAKMTREKKQGENMIETIMGAASRYFHVPPYRLVKRTLQHRGGRY